MFRMHSCAVVFWRKGDEERNEKLVYVSRINYYSFKVIQGCVSPIEVSESQVSLQATGTMYGISSVTSIERACVII